MSTGVNSVVIGGQDVAVGTFIRPQPEWCRVQFFARVRGFSFLQNVQLDLV
jgi:hypothetical protein